MAGRSKKVPSLAICDDSQCVGRGWREARWLKALDALVQDMSSISGIALEAHNLLSHKLKGSENPSWLLQALLIHCTHTNL